MKLTSRFAVIGAFGLVLAGCSGRSTPPPKKYSGDSLDRIQKTGVLLWGADVVGGVPYVYEDPKHPGSYIGFEKDVADAIAREMGVRLQLVIKAWDTLIPELQKGSFDMAMNGIENTEERGKLVLLSEPYFIYSQQITVRKGTRGISRLVDLRGKKVATLSGTAAEDILRHDGGVEVMINPEIIYSYRDLEQGKVDAVLLDSPIAAAYGAPNPKLENVGQSFAEGSYVIAFRSEDTALRQRINQILGRLKSSGELKAIYKKWGILDQHQKLIGLVS